MKSDLESSTQRSAKDPTGFNSWAGGGVASSILPSVKENPFAARMKVLEAKVASMEAQHRIDNVKMRALESKVVSMEAQHRIDNAKMRALESKMASMEAWIQEVIEPDSNSDIETEEDIKTINDNDSDGEAAKSFMAAKTQALEAKVAAQEARIAVLEQRTSFLVGLGLSLGVGLVLFNWMKKA